MYLLYLDDSGSAQNANERHLVLGGISVFERRTYHMARELDQLAEKYCAETPSTVEFHASEIFRGKSAPWKRLEKSQRCCVIKSVLQVLSDDEYGTYAFAVVVHKDSYPGRDPMEIAFEEICRRFDLQLQNLNSSQDQKNHQRGMIVLDESAYETTLQRLAVHFQSVGTRWGVLRNLAEVPLFVDSQASRLIQLADHVAYAVFRAYESADFNYLNLILHKFHADGQSGRIHGLVHKQTQNTRCMCHACLSRRLTAD